MFLQCLAIHGLVLLVAQSLLLNLAPLLLVPRNAQSGSALRDSQNKKGENSYYYAHDGLFQLIQLEP